MLIALLAVGLDTPTDNPQPVSSAGIDLPAQATDSWWAQARQHLAQREYHVTADGDIWQAPNRAQGLRFRFEAGAISAQPRRTSSRPWSWSWRTTAFGRTSTMAAVTATPGRPSANRIDFRHPDFVEWYLNSTAGLEQGFDVAAPPAGEGFLCIEAEVTTALTPQISAGATGFDYLDGDGAARLVYDKLLAIDATGRELPGTMELTATGLRLLVDDTRALYPVTIDPLLSSPDWTKESDHTDAEFGISASTAGDVNGDGYSDVIVGAPGYDADECGWAFVYHGTADGLHVVPDWDWDHYNYGARFGSSVAGLGDVNGDGYDDVAIGAPGFGTGSTGEVRVFHGSADGLAAVSSFIEQGDASVDGFGAIVAAAGDVNGDGYADLLTTGDGVFVFMGSDTGLRTYGHWNADDTGAFGAAVAGAGDVNGDGYDDILVGSPDWDQVYQVNNGRAQLFLGSADGPEDEDSWETHGGLSYVRTGTAVGAAGDMNGDGYADFVVSTPLEAGGHDHNIKCYYGSADGPEFAWSSNGEHVNTSFGTALAPAGDVNGDGYADVMVASEGYPVDGLYVGRVDIYYGGASVTGDAPDWSALGEQDQEHYGHSVAPAGDVNGDGFADIIIGAPDWSNPQVSEGRAQVFLGSPSLPTPLPNWVVESNQANAHLGSSVASLGDVNGDGYSDVLVGAAYFDNGQANEGAAFVYLGTQDGLMVVPFWYCESNQENALFGACVSAAGDVNGDGYPDALVGASNYEGSAYNEGHAFLWHSTPGGIPAGNPDNADWVGSHGQASSQYGSALAAAGDVNGDGYADIVVGAPNYDNGSFNEGMVLVYHGSSTGLSTTPAWTRDSDQADSRYGSAVASAGDFNGDGYDDIVVGAPQYDHPQSGEGMVSVYIGGPDGLAEGAPFWYAESDEDGAGLGCSVTSLANQGVGECSGVVAGAEDYDGSVAGSGAIFAWPGDQSPGASGTPSNASWSVLGDQAGGLAMVKLAAAGDIDGDGHGDLLVGVPAYDTYAGTNAGGILVYLGGPEGLEDNVPDGWVLGDQATAYLGWGVAGAGDVNGDGFDDLIMSADYYDAGQDGEGRVYLFYGNGPGGRVRKIKQMRDDFSAPVARGGLSGGLDAFGLDAMLRSAGGRGRARLEWEVDEYPGTFASPTRGFSEWVDTGAPDGAMGSRVLIQTVVDGLSSGTQYCWRARVRTDDPAFTGSPWHNLPGTGLVSPMLRTSGGPVGVHEDDLPAAAGRLTNHPNPFNPVTTICFQVPAGQHVRLAVYDVKGRRVALLLDGEVPAGRQEIAWQGRDDAGRGLASGVYMARLETPAETWVQKMLLAK